MHELLVHTEIMLAMKKAYNYIGLLDIESVLSHILPTEIKVQHFLSVINICDVGFYTG